jgi:hypothetical protein
MTIRPRFRLPLLSVVGALAVTALPLSAQAAGTQSSVVFSDDFESSSGLPAGWQSKFDGGISCANSPTTADDVSTYVNPDNWGPGHGRAMTVHANVHSEPSTYANSLAVRPFTYQGGGNYQADFSMRLWRIDPVYQNSYYGMNLTINRSRTEHFAEINIETNPGNADYGWLMYKRNVNGATTRLPIAHVGVNTNWHHVIANIFVDDSAGTYGIESVFLDGTWYTHDANGNLLQNPLPTRAVTWSDFNNFFVESHALWTKCDTSVTHIAVTLFDNVKLTYIPW